MHCPEPFGGSNETARVHQSTCWLGSGVAARDARTAARADAAHRSDDPRLCRQTTPKNRPAWRRSCRDCSTLGGATAATCGSTAWWAAGDANLIRKYAAELIALAPDVILAPGSTKCAPLLQATRTVPIVFTTLLDPVGAGFVDSLARPGGNATGFIAFEYGLSGKWLELLNSLRQA